MSVPLKGYMFCALADNGTFVALSLLSTLGDGWPNNGNLTRWKINFWSRIWSTHYVVCGGSKPLCSSFIFFLESILRLQHLLLGEYFKSQHFAQIRSLDRCPQQHVWWHPRRRRRVTQTMDRHLPKIKSPSLCTCTSTLEATDRSSIGTCTLIVVCARRNPTRTCRATATDMCKVV